MTLEIIGDLDDSSLYEWRRQKPDLSDFENKWQLTQKRWQPLGTFEKAWMGGNQRERVIVKEYVCFKRVAWAGFNVSGKNGQKGSCWRQRSRVLEELDYFHKLTQVIWRLTNDFDMESAAGLVAG